MQLSPFPCHLVPLRSKYFPQHPILKHPQPAFLPQCERPGFTTIQNHGQKFQSIRKNKLWMELRTLCVWLHILQFWNVVLEKDADQLDRWCEKWKSYSESEGKEYPTYNTWRKGNCSGHTLFSNCLLEHVIKVKIEGMIEMTGGRERRRKRLLNDLKKREITVY